MTLPSNLETDTPQINIGREACLWHRNSNIDADDDRESKIEKILCPHCRRTATNGIKCKGICVADSDY
jgi:hypothetical protein